MAKVDPDSGEMMSDEPDVSEETSGGHSDPAKDSGKDPHEQTGAGQSGG
ncbi:MAG: hypothetical protein KY439_07830 [Actinobacteria bacterium]|nr:hypothetical protein [Actinomycetota bacterium]